MRFLVSRMSTGPRRKPCEEAKRRQYIGYMQYRKRYQPADWYEHGENHREYLEVEAGGDDSDRSVRRDEKCMGWVVDIETLDDLTAFYRRYGAVMISETWCCETLLQLLIVDDHFD